MSYTKQQAVVSGLEFSSSSDRKIRKAIKKYLNNTVLINHIRGLYRNSNERCR